MVREVRRHLEPEQVLPPCPSNHLYSAEFISLRSPAEAREASSFTFNPTGDSHERTRQGPYPFDDGDNLVHQREHPSILGTFVALERRPVRCLLHHRLPHLWVSAAGRRIVRCARRLLL